MSYLSDQAAAARAAELAAEEQARETLRQELRTQAKDAITLVIAPVTWAQSGFQRMYTDLNNLLVVYSNGPDQITPGDVSLGANRTDAGNMKVRLVTGSGTEWTRRSEPLVNLADLGEALEAQV